MRKGFSIVELMVMIFVIALISVPFARLTTITLRDIPKSRRTIASNSSILNALKQIRKDVNSAKGFPKTFKGYTANTQALLIELEKDVIYYQIKEEKITKRILKNTKTGNEDIVSWLVPDAKIEWRILRKDNKGYAVEVRTYIEHKSGRNIEKKMANSHLYFRDAYQEAIK